MAKRDREGRAAATGARGRATARGGARRGAGGRGVRARPSQQNGGAAPSASRAAWEWARTLIGAFAIYFVVQAFLIQAFRIPSGSMEDTLLVGDWLFVNKALYGPKVPLTEIHLPSLSQPKRGGIVVFESPIEPGLNLVKRVIGTAGDTLGMRGGQLILNGEPQREPYVQHTNPAGNAADPGMSWQVRHLVPGAVDPAAYRPTRDDWGPIVVPPGHYFMMGDNRDASFDSRYYGFVRRDLIKGKPLFIYYSYDAKSPDSLPFLTAIRWDRIGNPIR
jgi:signal peptidase I